MESAQSTPPTPAKHIIFISHIVHEKPIALKLQEYLQLAFGPDLSAFVSSDLASIGGGRKWFEHIIDNLRGSSVVLVLLSQESSTRPWINFEAGFGDGAGACVIPIAIMGFGFDALKFPLAGYNGRSIESIEGIVSDIGRETGLVSKPVDTLEYRENIRCAEASVTYKSLILEPFWDGKSIRFSILNNGNIDADLLMLEAWCPIDAVEHILGNITTTVSNVLDTRIEPIDGVSYRYWVFTSVPIPNVMGVISLRSVLTPSMGRLELSHPSFPLKHDVKTHPKWDEFLLHYQVHARNYDTRREMIRLKDVQELKP